jgi:hypothetical protein
MRDPHLDEALGQTIRIPTAYRSAPSDALAALEGIILSNALPPPPLRRTAGVLELRANYPGAIPTNENGQ